MFRKSFEVVGYAYDASIHCLDCTRARFGDQIDGAVDSEGNPVTPVFLDSVTDDDCCNDCGESLAD